jgi:cobalt-zinc-cadmium efflux system protein
MHDHSHDHNPISKLIDLNNRFILGIILNSLFVLIEAVFGLYYNSLALLSDASHNLSDVASLLLALIAFRLAKKLPDAKYTYGYRKSTILISLFNATLLFIAMGGIIWESIHRLQTKADINGYPIVSIAGIGIVINALTAWLFLKDKEKDLNIKGAYLHMISDTLVSLGVLFSGVVILFTNWYWLDSAVSIVIALVVLFSSLDLLRKSFHLSIDAVPEGIYPKEIKKELELIKGILEVHHIHIWAISTTLNAFTAHVKLETNIEWKEVIRIKKSIRHALLHQNILHSTIEFETGEENCEEGNEI